MPLNVNLSTGLAPNAPGHAAGHNATNMAVNQTAAAVDALAGIARTGRLSDAGDLTTTAAAVGKVIGVTAVVSGRPSFALVEQTGSGGAVVSDATTLSKGVSRLLGGTADDPTVPWTAVTGKPTIPDSPEDIGAQPAGSYATTSALSSGLAGKAASAHSHGVADLTATGTRDSTTVLHGDNVWRVGASGGTTAHTHVIADLTATGTRDATTVLHGDAVWRAPTLASVAHTHVIADLTATGTRSSTTVLHGDAVWRAPTVTASATVAPTTLTFATSLTIDPYVASHRIVTATANFTLNEPSAGDNGHMLRLRVIASGAQRVVTFAAALRRPTGMASTLTIPSGRRADIGLYYEPTDGWTVLAAQAQA